MDGKETWSLAHSIAKGKIKGCQNKTEKMEVIQVDLTENSVSYELREKNIGAMLYLLSKLVSDERRYSDVPVENRRI